MVLKGGLWSLVLGLLDDRFSKSDDRRSKAYSKDIRRAAAVAHGENNSATIPIAPNK
jgi:hypothetical protein